MSHARPTLLIYNTVDRLLRGDLFHTVTVHNVLHDLADFPADWPVVGVGTTNWLRRNGEVMPDGTAGETRFWWTDPDEVAGGTVIDLKVERPADSIRLKTPVVGDNDRVASFPFLAAAVCNPAAALHYRLDEVDNVHEWLKAEFARINLGVAGIQLRGRFGAVKTTYAYNIPLGGLDLSAGYKGEHVFRFADYESGEWVINGVYAANPSMHPFISVAGVPLHLHGYQPALMRGGHIVNAETVTVNATVWPMDDLVMQIHNVSKAMQPVEE
jgi:hypothetical protein